MTYFLTNIVLLVHSLIRLLEEGDLDGAESIKLRLEQAQRERRKHMEESNVQYQPKWFRYVELSVRPVLVEYFIDDLSINLKRFAERK